MSPIARSSARLLSAIGATSAAELNVERLSKTMAAPATTLRRHVELLETLFLIRRLPASTASAATHTTW